MVQSEDICGGLELGDSDEADLKLSAGEGAGWWIWYEPV